VKYVQVIDGAENCVYDIFATTEEEFSIIFPDGTDIAFIEDIFPHNDKENEHYEESRYHDTLINTAFKNLWKHRVKKSESQGIHGIIFYEHENKKKYYPSRKDEEAVNPDGTNIRDSNSWWKRKK